MTVTDGQRERDGEAAAARGLTRRRLLAAGGGALGLAVAAGAGYAVGEASAASPDEGRPRRDEVLPFDGRWQAGVATPAQARLVFGAFDFLGADARELRDLLRAWSDAARLLTADKPVGTPAGEPLLPPLDTGEALGLPPSRLTITIGLGSELFERDGDDRLGLRARMPAGLRPLGPLPGDELDPARCGGDLCVQACADDPQVAFHAVRNLHESDRLEQFVWLDDGEPQAWMAARSSSHAASAC